MKLLITTSTFPADDRDPVPDFVQKQVLYLKKLYPDYSIHVHAPHDYHNRTWQARRRDEPYTETRYHYFFPRRLELLTGRGILPALKRHKWLYLQIPFLCLFHGITLLRLAGKIKPDLIYAHWFTPQAINAAIVSGILKIPFVFTTHASDVSVLKRLPFSRKLVKWVCRRSSAYTAVSERTAGKLADFFPDDEWRTNYARKLKIIPMGTACSTRHQSNHPAKPSRIGTSELEILFIGRLVEKKGVDRLINAIAGIPGQERNNLRLLVAGEGPEKEALEKLSDSLNISGQVEFAGHISGDAKTALYERADIVCIPSIITADGDSEGFPLVLMEALYHGKIVIASNVSGAEALLDNKTNGFIFDANSADSLKSTILNVMRLSPAIKRSISENARALGSEYTWEKLIPEYHHLLMSALERQ